MAAVNLGVIGLTNKRAYSDTATYTKGNFVLYGGSSYVALGDVPAGILPTNAAYWQLLAQGGAGAEGLTIDDIIDNLDSEAADKVLSAGQGHALKAMLAAKLDSNKVVNNLTTTEEGYALDARQGKAIANKLGSGTLDTTAKTIIPAINELNAFRSLGDIWHPWGDGSPIWYTKRSGIAFVHVAGLGVNLPAVTWTKVMADYLPAGYRFAGGQLYTLGYVNIPNGASFQPVGITITQNGDIQASSPTNITNGLLQFFVSYPAA